MYLEIQLYWQGKQSKDKQTKNKKKLQLKDIQQGNYYKTKRQPRNYELFGMPDRD